uniref:Uncharacterized protein n=1 Tax=Plectus sambesii TaxID=2011161 RepID=A0A914X076_9BILA
MQLLLKLLLLLAITLVHATSKNETTDLKRSVTPSSMTSTDPCAPVLRKFGRRLMSRRLLPAMGRGVRVFCIDLSDSTSSRWNWLTDNTGRFVFTHGYWGADEVCDGRYWFRWFHIQNPIGTTINSYSSCKLATWTQMCVDQNDGNGHWVPQPAQSDDDDYHAFAIDKNAGMLTFASAAITLHRPFFALSRSVVFRNAFQRKDVNKIMKC